MKRLRNPAGVDYASTVIKNVCSLLDKPEGITGDSISFEAEEVTGLRRYTAVTTPHGALGALVILGYLTVADNGRTGRRHRINPRFVYTATKDQLERLRKEVMSRTGKLFI